MKIKNIQIQNFKGIEKKELVFHSRRARKLTFLLTLETEQVILILTRRSLELMSSKFGPMRRNQETSRSLRQAESRPDRRG